MDLQVSERFTDKGVRSEHATAPPRVGTWDNRGGSGGFSHPSSAASKSSLTVMTVSDILGAASAPVIVRIVALCATIALQGLPQGVALLLQQERSKHPPEDFRGAQAAGNRPAATGASPKYDAAIASATQRESTSHAVSQWEMRGAWRKILPLGLGGGIKYEDDEMIGGKGCIGPHASPVRLPQGP